MEKIKGQDPVGQTPKAKLEQRQERENQWLFISPEESELIHKAGGEYRGFVRDKHSTHYEDVLVTKHAYFDLHYKRVIQLHVSTEGVDELGDSDLLGGPSSVKGFSIMVAKWDSSGNDVEPGKFIDILPANFPERRVSIREMRRLAREVSDFMMRNPEKSQADLIAGGEALLRENGWTKADSD